MPVRTVSRKRDRLGKDHILSYYTAVELQPNGTGRFNTQHLITIKFKLCITRTQVVEEIRNEPNVANVFSELIRNSHIAEIDGHIALVMTIEGQSDSDVADNLQGEIIPSLKKNHGEDSIAELRTIRLLCPIRCERNYLPLVNMEDGYLKKEWPDDAIIYRLDL